MTAHPATPDAVRETPTPDLQSLRAMTRVLYMLRAYDTGSDQFVLDHGEETQYAALEFLRKHGPRLLSIAEAYANAPIVHDVTGRHGFIGHHVRIVPCDAGGEPTTGGRGE